MPRKVSEAVPEGNGPVPHQEEFGSGEPMLADVYRLFEERFDKQQKIMDSFFNGMDSCFDRWNRKLDETSDGTRDMDHHVTSLEHGARQPRLAVEADGLANTNTRERTEGAAIAVQVMHGYSCTSAQKGSRWTKDLDQFRRDGRTSRSPLQGRRFGRGRRHVARSVSPILGDALNSRWWLSYHRRNFHNNGDHRHQVTSSVLLEERGELEEEKITDFHSIRLVRKQCLSE